MTKLILLRHGQSAWNKKNVFTGWIDVPLSLEGINESIEAGKQMKDIAIDVIFTSSLVRAQTTAFLAMAQNHHNKIPYVRHDKDSLFAQWYEEGSEGKDLIPVHVAWQLNERMYGKLQGKNKQQMRAEFGDEQVHLWRRSYAVEPPSGESLKKTADRVIPFFRQEVLPYLEKGQNVLISAHGNSLRSIVMYLEKLSEEAVVSLEIATGEIRSYKYTKGMFLLL